MNDENDTELWNSRLSETLPGGLPLDQVPLYFHTARNMQWQQLTGTLERKIRQELIPRLPVDFDARYERRIPGKSSHSLGPIAADTERLRQALTESERTRCRRKARLALDGELTFLNHTIQFDGDTPPWEHPDLDSQPLLWRLKLQSLEFLEWAVLGFEDPAEAPDSLSSRFTSWINDWYVSHRVDESAYLRRNWIPHAVSLRILNLSRFFTWIGGDLPSNADRTAILRALHKSGQFLSRHVEFDIGGNHLIENAIALVTAGIFVKEREWVIQGLDVLRQTTVQFEPDGGHFERSPMYHIQTITRYLTAISILQETDSQPPEWLVETAERGVKFLKVIHPPDDRIPLFNDSVFRQSLSLEACLAYARSIGVADASEPISNSAPETGYYWLDDRDGQGRMLVDGGPVGPPHLPAHSHNDFLSYVLWIGGQRIVTDTGTFGYAGDLDRAASRGVQGHNSVQVGDLEPIPIGGQYLMGRRTSPDVRRARLEDVDGLRGQYTRRAMGESYQHRRDLYSGPGWWFVWDTVKQADSSVCSRVHIHPSLTLEQEDASRRQWLVRETEESSSHPLAFLTALRSEFNSKQSPYFPEFGVKVSRPLLELEVTGTDSGFGYLITPFKPGRASVSFDVDGPDHIQIDQTAWELPELAL